MRLTIFTQKGAKTLINVCNVEKYFDDFKVLNGLNLHVKKGSIYGLVGPNGAGKTTIINHLTGAYVQNCGTIKIDGEYVYENEKLKQRVLSIADDWFYFGTATIKEMSKFYSDIYNRFDKERYEKIGQLFNIDEKRQIRKLSKGMKKQVAFWITLSCMPDVLILDEPLDGLDPVMRKQILNLIIADVSERGMTVLVSSHNLRELEDICDHVGIIFNGKMVIEKSLDDLKGAVKKYQVLLPDEAMEEIEKELDILHKSKIGSITTFIVKDKTNNSEAIIKKLSPQLCESVKLTLEEVFIYELGGMGYNVKDIVV